MSIFERKKVEKGKGVMGENQTHKIQNGVLVPLAHGGNVGAVGA